MEWKQIEDLFLKPEVMEVEKNETRVRNPEKERADRFYD